MMAIANRPVGVIILTVFTILSLLALHSHHNGVSHHSKTNLGQIEKMIQVLEEKNADQIIISNRDLLTEEENVLEISKFHKPRKQVEIDNPSVTNIQLQQEKQISKSTTIEETSDINKAVSNGFENVSTDRNGQSRVSDNGNTSRNVVENITTRPFANDFINHGKLVDHDDPERQKRRKITPLKKLKRDQLWPAKIMPSYGEIFSNLDYSRYSDEDASYLRQFTPEYRERARRVSQVCSDSPRLLKQRVTVKTLVWDTRHQPNIVWCQLPKIASSSWNADFFLLGHENDVNAEELLVEEKAQASEFHLHHEVFRMFAAPNTTVERNNVFLNSVRFIIVRHPFVRLVSAYRDKITQDRPRPIWFHYERLQRLIIDKYRPLDSFDTSPHPSFQEFVQYVLDQTKGLVTPREWNKKVHCWKPYYASCGVCVHDFQLILKIETLQQDTLFLATLAGLTQLKEKSQWRHQINGISSDELSLQLFEELTKTQANELYDRYKVDFDLFDYSPQLYIDRAVED